MRAGKLDKTIIVERNAPSVDDFGTPTEGWSEIARVRAQVIRSSTEEFLRGYGETAETAIIFRIRHLGSITTADRVLYADKAFNVREIKELGRRAGYDLRCVSSGDAP